MFTAKGSTERLKSHTTKVCLYFTLQEGRCSHAIRSSVQLQHRTVPFCIHKLIKVQRFLEGTLRLDSPPGFLSLSDTKSLPCKFPIEKGKYFFQFPSLNVQTLFQIIVSISTDFQRVSPCSGDLCGKLRKSGSGKHFPCTLPPLHWDSPYSTPLVEIPHSCQGLLSLNTSTLAAGSCLLPKRLPAPARY